MAKAVASAAEFAGNDRFLIRRQLGRGGMGVVYEAFDRERQMEVALKTMHDLEAAAIYRFKNEFRALANVSHPNLISLFELLSFDDQWFFTMELLRGTDFLKHVSGLDSGSNAATSVTSATMPEDGASTATLGEDTRPSVPARGSLSPSSSGEVSDVWVVREASRPLDTARLRAALRQLVLGVSALHASGHLHRDIKPSNVIVTPENRVVLLDFGVITQLAASRGPKEARVAVGTPIYMAPEQAAGECLSASDWYSVGVVLFEALTGQRPFTGQARAVMSAKQRVEARAPHLLRPDVPLDLSELCSALLRIDPVKRPTASEILRALGASDRPARRPPSIPASVQSSAGSTALLVGRERHLAVLAQAFSDAERGGLTVHVHGSSGMGKSSLAQHFLDQVEGAQGAVVLAGRCYERESVPYKAIDSLIDSLCRYLVSLPRAEAEALMPEDVHLLARVFPVLRRVEAVAEQGRKPTTPDPHELRRRAFGALRELLSRLGAKVPLVLFIDDLQWGDIDSALLLDSLMRPPGAPRLLLLVAYRTEDLTRSALLKALSLPGSLLGPWSGARELAIEPISEEEAHDLAVSLLDDAEVDVEAASTIAVEARGNPYFVHELVRFVRSGAGGGDATVSLSLDEVIRARVGRLPPSAQSLLEIVAVAGKPVAQDIANRAAELGGAERAALMQLLRSTQMVRISGARDQDLVEVYHDRIRETVVASLEDARRARHHRRLAVAIQTSGDPDAETLVVHFLGAGERETAADYAIEAAGQAAESLAFDRAAELYRLALELREYPTETKRKLLVKLGDALANAGRGGESADTYIDAASRSLEGDALELERLAAGQYLRSGRFDRGVATLRTVLSRVGLTLAATPQRGLVQLLFRRAQLWLRGLGYTARKATEIPESELVRIDVCWSAATGLGMVDTFRGAAFQAHQLLLALRAGEPSRVCRALALEICYGSTAGVAGEPRVRKIMAQVSAVSEEMGQLELIGWAAGAHAIAEWQYCDLHASRTHAERGIQTLSQCTGVAWELCSVQCCLMWSLLYLGEMRELVSRTAALLEDAKQRGDLFAASSMLTGPPSTAWLIADEPEWLRRESAAAMEGWSEHGFHLQHYYELYTAAQCDLYEGDGIGAYQRMRARWPALQRSLLLNIPAVRVEAISLRARCALAAAGQTPDNSALLRAAERDAKRIAREPTRWAAPIAAMIRAGAASARLETVEAARLFGEAEKGFELASMAMHAKAAQWRRAELLGVEGRNLARSAELWFLENGAKNPAQLLVLLAPGKRGTRALPDGPRRALPPPR
jgi:serine/threonine protein kinase